MRVKKSDQLICDGGSTWFSFCINDYIIKINK